MSNSGYIWDIQSLGTAVFWLDFILLKQNVVTTKFHTKKIIAILIVVLTTGAAMAQSNIAHVNSQTLLDTMPSRVLAIKKYQEFEAAGIKELQEMQVDLEQAIAKYQQSVQSGTMSPVIQKIEEDKLQKKQAALQERDQSLQVELQAYSNELNAPILQRVQDAIKMIAEKKNLDYVIDITAVMYAQGDDITDEVVVELLKMDAEASNN